MCYFVLLLSHVLIFVSNLLVTHIHSDTLGMEANTAL